MIRPRAVILPLSGMACAALTWTLLTTPTIATPGTSQGLLPAAVVTATPGAKVSKSREGAWIDGWQNASGRFPAKPQNHDPGRDSTSNQTTDNRFTTPQQDDKPDRPRRIPPTDFRLNIGMCGRQAPDGTVPGPARCQPFTPDRPQPSRRTLPPEVVQPPQPRDVTWQMVLTESTEALFPKLAVAVQPADRTLVNLDTIVYTQDLGVTTITVPLLGFQVVVEATPMSYTWHFGDGSTLTTTSPGKPYPAKEITHKYMKRANVRLTVTTNYAARFNVAGTGWQYVDGTAPITGPATALQVREAVPVLVDPPN
jgi:hypothetical protein